MFWLISSDQSVQLPSRKIAIPSPILTRPFRSLKIKNDEDRCTGVGEEKEHTMCQYADRSAHLGLAQAARTSDWGSSESPHPETRL